ncbi:hypothetical protein RchiOBHm_Chr5g0072251 [Rosa chinensis]|uniref:Uncharacterized protein n=1 Tax=Rosa chinensis TaxID=74649 RepID=A0A2P6QKM9_ROSCH|nr:hypothetical protein RchiOBHm_Chr5g0072251 [Rosa chinensis]
MDGGEGAFKWTRLWRRSKVAGVVGKLQVRRSLTSSRDMWLPEVFVVVASLHLGRLLVRESGTFHWFCGTGLLEAWWRVGAAAARSQAPLGWLQGQNPITFVLGPNWAD